MTTNTQSLSFGGTTKGTSYIPTTTTHRHLTSGRVMLLFHWGCPGPVLLSKNPDVHVCGTGSALFAEELECQDTWALLGFIVGICAGLACLAGVGFGLYLLFCGRQSGGAAKQQAVQAF